MRLPLAVRYSSTGDADKPTEPALGWAFDWTQLEADMTDLRAEAAYVLTLDNLRHEDRLIIPLDERPGGTGFLGYG